MIDEREVREMLLRRAHTVSTLAVDTPTAVRRARRRLVVNGVVATVAAAAIAVAAFAGVDAIRTAPIPGDRSGELGIFAPVAGRIVYVNEGIDRGYDRGLWAVNPSGPSDTTEGLSVADDVASTLVRLGPKKAIPLDWSSDGTKLLFKRTSEDLFPKEYLSILHADGSETQLNRDPLYFGGATISPDGTRVVFAAWGDELGLYVVDAGGGRPVRLPYPSAGDIVYSPTFSPDGTQIAYLVTGNDEEHVWVANADGSDAHEILADEATVFGGVSGPEWSPAGDRLAIGLGDYKGSDGLGIYTFAPDGSDFTQVITGGISPYWSPDGSEIAYTILCEEQPTPSCPVGSILRSRFDLLQDGGKSAGLAIADADGSNVREFGFAASGPWHPVQIQPTTPSPAPSEPTGSPTELYRILDGEVTFGAASPWELSFAGWDHGKGLLPGAGAPPAASRGPADMTTLLLYDRDDQRVAFEQRIRVLADPLPIETACRQGTAPADARALARSIQSDPDLEATAPVAVSVGGIEALRMDVVAAPEASVCELEPAPWVVTETGLMRGHRMRLYLLDLPEGLSARILAIAIVAPEPAFERVMEAAAPIVDSFEFRSQ